MDAPDSHIAPAPLRADDAERRLHPWSWLFVLGQQLRQFIVPLVAFDARGFRLGYGGGFYDRTLEGLRARRPTIAIGFAFDAQEMDAVPIEDTDQRLDFIVTESGLRAF